MSARRIRQREDGKYESVPDVAGAGPLTPDDIGELEHIEMALPAGPWAVALEPHIAVDRNGDPVFRMETSRSRKDCPELVCLRNLLPRILATLQEDRA